MALYLPQLDTPEGAHDSSFEQNYLKMFIFLLQNGMNNFVLFGSNFRFGSEPIYVQTATHSSTCIDTATYRPPSPNYLDILGIAKSTAVGVNRALI